MKGLLSPPSSASANAHTPSQSQAYAFTHTQSLSQARTQAEEEGVQGEVDAIDWNRKRGMSAIYTAPHTGVYICIHMRAYSLTHTSGLSLTPSPSAVGKVVIVAVVGVNLAGYLYLRKGTIEGILIQMNLYDF